MDPHTLSHPKKPSLDSTPPPSASSTISAAIKRQEMASPGKAPIRRLESDAVLQELRRRRHEDDPENFYHYEIDSAKDHLKRLFWADADSQLAYILECRDVVVFDTTYRTNKYGVPFVPFMGLNRHRRPVLLGCGVVSDQSLESYLWLLRSFMMCCGGDIQEERPTSVITDGGDAVVAAVKIVLPDANHRICSWHVEQGVEEHLHGSPARNEFRSMIYDACSPAAFEERWYRFMASHRTAASQPWLDAMYGKRELWAAAFVHGKFFLGMASDQRTECLATALHTGLHDGMSLPDLLRHADACTHALRRDAFRLDVEAESCPLELTTKHRYLEEHAARRFTPANFYLLREEIKMIDSFEVVRTTLAGDHHKLYVVGFKQRPGVLFHVERSDGAVKCSCRKMEREGLPCRHILCMMLHDRTPWIPDCCVLRRLRRRGDTKAGRIDEMEELGRQVFDLASEDAKEFKEIKEFFGRWLEDRRRGSGAVAVEDNEDAANAESGCGNTPTTKKIKLLDD